MHLYIKKKTFGVKKIQVCKKKNNENSIARAIKFALAS